MSETARMIQAIADAAGRWRDPEYATRAKAVAATLDADNTFTEEAVAFAVNQQMSLLTPSALEAWLAGRTAASHVTVGVLNAGNIPFVGLQDFLAVALTGHTYLASLSSRSPALLPAFVQDVGMRCESLRADFGAAEEVLAGAQAVIATGSNETLDWVRAQCDDHGVPPERRLLRGHSYSVAVLDGRETDKEYENLAEDMLLHEGMGCRNVAIVWAPAELSPDGLLEAMAHFRGVFPAHAQTPGRLAMQQAFLEAVDMPHAYGEGLEFLLSRGDPEEQPPGHVRWTEYDDLNQVRAWLHAQRHAVQLLVASDRVRSLIPDVVLTLPFGDAQRPMLDWCPDGKDTVDFLSAL